MIDTHAHLNFPEYQGKIDQIVEESKKAGVTGIIIASSNLADSKASVELARKYPGYLFASVGIHPQKTDPENKMTIDEQSQSLENLILDAKRYPLDAIVALGETGLDFSEAPPGEENRSHENQEKLFLGHIKLAQKYNLPLIIHAREAVDEVIEILRRFTVHDSRFTPHGVFHCYAGGQKRISKILSLSKKPALSEAEGWYFGFDGNLTYDGGLQAVLKLVPQERILIETDSPFLAPVPHRGEVNSPAYLPLIQEKINQIFGQDLTKKIVENSQRIFNFH
jgi:TatD DNase family protein